MISCITSLMDREYALEEMLPSWTKVDQIKDLVIVDWNSKKPIIENKIVKEQMEKYNKIKIIRVENQKYFNRCLAWNLANYYTNQDYKILLKLDIDYVNLNSDWINTLSLQEDSSLDNYFITGAYKFYENSLGFLLVNKRDFGKGYNENLRPIWGHEDQDLNKRLTKAEPKYTSRSFNEWKGVKEIIFFNIKNHIHHIPHSDEARVMNEENANVLLKDGKLISFMLMYKESRINAKIAIEKPDWESRKYKTLDISDNYIRLELI